MNHEYNYILLLARNFGSFLTLIPLLARLIILSILLILSKKLVPIRAVSSTNTVSAVVNSWFNQNMKTKPKVKLLKMNVTKVLTKNYEDQQKPAKKTKPIYWTKTLILS